MPNVKIDDDVMVRRHFRDHGKQRPRRIGEPGILGVRGEDMDSLAFMIVFSRYTALPVHCHGAKVREVSNPVVPPGHRFQHQLAQAGSAVANRPESRLASGCGHSTSARTLSWRSAASGLAAR